MFSSVFRLVLVTCTLLGSFAAQGFAGSSPFDKAGTTGASFLKIGVGARPIGMGGAFTAVANDANAMYWNPAGLAIINGGQLSLMHNKWLQDINYEFLGFAYGDSGEAAYAFGISYLWMGDIPITTFSDKLGASGATFTARDLSVVFGYSHVVMDNVYAGITLKRIRSSIEEINATATAVDVGIRTGTPLVPGLTFGAVVQNLGTKLKFVKDADRLPLTYKGGVAYTNRMLTLAVDVSKPVDHFLRVNTGGEFVLMGALALRGGYNSGNEVDRGISGGAGVTLKRVSIDYAFVPYGVLGNTHRVSAMFRF